MKYFHMYTYFFIMNISIIFYQLSSFLQFYYDKRPFLFLVSDLCKKETHDSSFDRLSEEGSDIYV